MVSMKMLNFIDVSSNLLTGTIPVAVASLPMLNLFKAHVNKLSGSTSILPLFNLFLTFFEPQFNLCFVGNLKPQFGNHGLQTLGMSGEKWHEIRHDQFWVLSRRIS